LRIVFLMLMFVPLTVFSQITPTPVPKPSEVPSDYNLRDERYYYDFDGDGSKDVLQIYYKSLGDPGSYFAIYSYHKKQILITIPMIPYTDFDFEDLNDDGAWEIIIVESSKRLKIFTINTSTVKKKVQ